MAHRLAHRVGGPLKPVGIVGRLFGRDDVDEALAEQIHSIRLRDMTVQRRRVELRQHEDAAHVRVQAVADRHVDQPVFAANRHCRLRPVLRQWKEARPLAAAQNQREYFVVHRHDSSKS